MNLSTMNRPSENEKVIESYVVYRTAALIDVNSDDLQ